MDTKTQGALKLAIEALEDAQNMIGDGGNYIPNYFLKPINACKEALEKNKGSKFLGIINLESVDPLSETERKRLIEATMECLLEEGELGKLGMLLNRYEETIRNAEQQNGASQLRQPLSDNDIAKIGLANNMHKDGDFYEFARAIERAHGIGE